jgi:hypothetical protein
MKKMDWALGSIGFVIVCLLLILFIFHGTGEKSVSNFYLIPAGTFSPFHWANEKTVSNFYLIPAGTFSPFHWANEKTVSNIYLVPGGNISMSHEDTLRIVRDIAKPEKNVSIFSVTRQPEDGMIHISGLTDLPVNSGVMYEIWPADSTTRKKTVDDIEGISGRTFTYGKEGLTVWSVDLNLTVWRPGKYIINAWPEKSDPRNGDRKTFFLPLNDTIRNGLGKDSGTGEVILDEISPSELSSLPISVTPERTPDKSFNTTNSSSEFLAYMNAPVITRNEKDQCQRLIADSKGFKKFKDISQGPTSVTWAYPYTGKQMISTIVGTDTSDVYGLYYAHIDPKNGSVLDEGFVDWKKYW